MDILRQPKRKNTTKLGQSLPSTSTSTPRPNIHGSKKSDGTKRVLFTGDSITGDRFRLQLIHLSRALREKRPEYEQT